MKVMVIFGTRPEAIKLAPVIKELRKYPDKVKTVVAVTAQHRLMLDQVLELFQIQPNYDLNLMQPGHTLFNLSADSLRGIKKIIDAEDPDLVLVQGDTTSAFIAGLAAFYDKLKLAHVEAGLRTGDKFHPFPEEMNRKLICSLTDLHFAPTESNKQNLLKENVPEDKIFVTGNTVIDALYMVVKKDIPLKFAGVEKIDFQKRILLVTAHRRETFGIHIQEICAALADLAKRNRDLEIIYPVHLNPNIIKPVEQVIGGMPNIHLIEPLEYGMFCTLMIKSHLILTDSGGIQEEAPSLGKPVLVLREKTERMEAIEAGTVIPIGRKKERIIAETENLLNDDALYNKMASAANPYGDGQAASRIVEILLNQGI
ncbi:MAG: non-hydrolyzing UDP-N-acetylglucosamine 2-epimerase [bacterium]